MRVLYITPKAVYPKIDGGCVAMDNFLQLLLNENIEVKHLTLSTEKHSFDINLYPSAIKKKTIPEAVDVLTEVTPLKGLVNLFKKGSYNVNRFHSHDMVDLITRTLNASHFDTVILDSLFSTSYLAAIRNAFNGKVILRMHNIESDLWDAYAENEISFLKRVYLNKLAKNIRKYEFQTANLVDGILTISNDDLQALENANIKVPMITIPFSILVKEAPHSQYENTNLFHLGTMNWNPNIEAVNRLVELFPRIVETHPNLELHIAGSNFPVNYLSQEASNIYADGFIENPDQFAIDQGILVSPIISGSGVRIKILEMMSIGIPIITTAIGAQGINYLENNCLLIANSDEEIITMTTELIKNKKRQKELGKAAIHYITNNHKTDDISSKLVHFLDQF